MKEECYNCGDTGLIYGEECHWCKEWRQWKNRAEKAEAALAIATHSEPIKRACEYASDIREENKKLKYVVHFMFLALQFYGADRNYKEDRPLCWPDETSRKSILRDRGQLAREALIKIEGHGFPWGIIRTWVGL